MQKHQGDKEDGIIGKKKEGQLSCGENTKTE